MSNVIPFSKPINKTSAIEVINDQDVKNGKSDNDDQIICLSMSDGLVYVGILRDVIPDESSLDDSIESYKDASGRIGLNGYVVIEYPLELMAVQSSTTGITMSVGRVTTQAYNQNNFIVLYDSHIQYPFLPTKEVQELYRSSWDMLNKQAQEEHDVQDS